MSKVTSLTNIISDDDEELLESKCLHPSENMNIAIEQRLDSILHESADIQGELIRKIIFYYNSTGLSIYKTYLLDLIRCCVNCQQFALLCSTVAQCCLTLRPNSNTSVKCL